MKAKNKEAAMDALREIREAFKRSKITEKELLESGREVRKEISNKHNSRKGLS